MLQNEYVDKKVISWNTLRGFKLEWISLRKDVQLLESALIITTIMTATVLHCSCHHQADIKLSKVVSLSTTRVFWDDGPGLQAVTETSGVLRTPDRSITIYQSTRCNIQLYTDRHKHRYAYRAGRKHVNTGLFISPSGISELDCATTKTDTAERSISISRESLQVFFVLGALA